MPLTNNLSHLRAAYPNPILWRVKTNLLVHHSTTLLAVKSLSNKKWVFPKSGYSSKIFQASYSARFLLTDLDPRDRLEEEMASWKIWLVSAHQAPS